MGEMLPEQVSRWLLTPRFPYTYLSLLLYYGNLALIDSGELLPSPLSSF